MTEFEKLKNRLQKPLFKTRYSYYYKTDDATREVRYHKIPLADIRKQLRAEQIVIQKRIKTIKSKGYTSPTIEEYEQDKISISKKMSIEELTKEILKARRFYSSRYSTIQGAEEYTKERDMMYEMLKIQYPDSNKAEVLNAFYTAMAHFPQFIQKIMESEQLIDDIVDEYEGEDVTADELIEEIRQEIYNRAGDFFRYRSANSKR